MHTRRKIHSGLVTPRIDVHVTLARVVCGVLGACAPWRSVAMLPESESPSQVAGLAINFRLLHYDARQGSWRPAVAALWTQRKA